MSNDVGRIFEYVIEETGDQSRIDFEENGVNQQTLEDLKQGWKEKLSSLGGARYPWDVDPVQQYSQAQFQQSHTQQQETGEGLAPLITPQSGMSVPPHPLQSPSVQVSQLPHRNSSASYSVPDPPLLNDPTPVKSEFQSTVPFSAVPPHNTNAGMSAQQRAASALHQRYGAAAANQVQQLQTQSQNVTQTNSPSTPQNTQPTHQYDPPPPYSANPSASQTLTQTQQEQQQQPPSQEPTSAQAPVTDGDQDKQAPTTSTSTQELSPAHNSSDSPKSNHSVPTSGNPSLVQSQTDGPSDALLEWKAEVSRRREAARNNNGHSDRIIREYVRQRALENQGNGDLRPLPRQTSQKKRTKIRNCVPSDMSMPPGSPNPAPNVTSYDGPGEDGIGEEDWDDENAINSDLDDPEDEVDDDDDDEQQSRLMLCTYDKVQRIRTRYKCTLKDGIMSTNDRVYVFHKAQGEFEW